MMKRCLGCLKISPVSALIRTGIKTEWLNLLKFKAVAHFLKTEWLNLLKFKAVAHLLKKEKKERKIKRCEVFHRKQTPSS